MHIIHTLKAAQKAWWHPTFNVQTRYVAASLVTQTHTHTHTHTHRMTTITLVHALRVKKSVVQVAIPEPDSYESVIWPRVKPEVNKHWTVKSSTCTHLWYWIQDANHGMEMLVLSGFTYTSCMKLASAQEAILAAVSIHWFVWLCITTTTCTPHLPVDSNCPITC